MRIFEDMRFARVPGKIRTLACFAFMLPVIAAVQSALASNLPWWKLDWQAFQPGVPIVTTLTLALLWLLVRGGRVTRVYYVLFACGWFAVSFVLALRGNNAWYGASLLLLCSWLAFYGWLLFLAYDSPYIDSGQRWFEGAPASLPKVTGRIELPAGSAGPYAVTRLGDEGVYLVGPAIQSGGKRDPLWVELEFREHRLRAQGILIRSRFMNKGSESWGIGVQFKHPDLDLQKEIADFVESLRGEGYVS